ncbi:MAG: hypothetical protein IJ647_04840 [Prevotella sp.]|nr:hypothetical protein [Prevotella sp.]
MPYIRIKAYPKNQATKEKVVEAINKAFVDNWGCPPQAIRSGVSIRNSSGPSATTHDNEGQHRNRL